ncbi:MAG TPA: hypothetical protein VII54_02115 [Gaiellaceae bacterium]
MKNLQTLKLGASFIGTAHPRQARAAAPVEATQELPAPVAEVAQTEPQPVVPAATQGSRHLLALLALEAIATAAAVEATGAIHNAFLRFATFGLALFAAAGLLAALAIAFKSQRPAKPTVAATAPAARRPFSASKALLMLLMAAGIAAYFGGSGTFAGFTAETSNPNDALASGTLILRNNVASNCDSNLGESNNNVNVNCNVALSFTNQEPGVYVGTATVTLTNTGSLNASKLYLWAPYGNGVFNGATINPTNTVNSLSLYASGHGPAGVEGTIAGGDLVVVTSGSSSQTFKVGAAGAAPGATSIPIVNDVTYPNVSTITISAGATVADQSSDTTAANTNCYDTQQTVYTFNPTTNNPLCSTAVLYVQETTGGKNYCWWGNTSSSPAAGACNAPISTKPSAVAGGVVSAGSTYTVTALTGNIKAGDTLLFTEGGNQVSCTANGSNYYVGATSITLSGTACTLVSGTNTGFDNNTVITDSTTLQTIASDGGTNSVSQFDIHKNYSGKIELIPVSANGTTTPTGTDLAASGGSRTFLVGIILPGPAAAQNQLQGLKSTFGLTWHIDQ